MKKNPGFQTHYDNLKVSQDAPYEIIQAAYRTLAKKYHPDLNKQDPECARIMKIINESYVVLSDPEKRRLHDSWITK
ncbi:DnaJ domain-containing protein, partial [Escherichia coli]|nr:DnaJ domain-containing protein [Escherichia coli]